MAIYADNYQPYFYIIQDDRTGIYYAGVKWGKNSTPHRLMVEGGYMTSSKVIHQIVRMYGIDVFTVRKIRVFDTARKARDYETRFLRKVGARNNPMFYNSHNNDHLFSYHDERYKEKMIEVYGVDDPNKSPEIIERIKRSNNERLGVDWPMMSDECKSKRVDTYLTRYGVSNPMQSEDIRQKLKDSNVVKYGVDNIFKTEWAKTKTKQTLKERYGAEHPMHCDDIKNKQKTTTVERHGVVNVFLLDSVKAKIKDRTNYLLSRPELDILRKYQKKYKLRFGQGWVRKSDEYIQTLLKNTIEEYGELDSR